MKQKKHNIYEDFARQNAADTLFTSALISLENGNYDAAHERASMSMDYSQDIAQRLAALHIMHISEKANKMASKAHDYIDNVLLDVYDTEHIDDLDEILDDCQQQKKEWEDR